MARPLCQARGEMPLRAAHWNCGLGEDPGHLSAGSFFCDGISWLAAEHMATAIVT